MKNDIDIEKVKRWTSFIAHLFNHYDDNDDFPDFQESVKDQKLLMAANQLKECSAYVNGVDVNSSSIYASNVSIPKKKYIKKSEICTEYRNPLTGAMVKNPFVDVPFCSTPVLRGKIRKRLHDLGVTSIQQLLALHPERLRSPNSIQDGTIYLIRKYLIENESEVPDHWVNWQIVNKYTHYYDDQIKEKGNKDD